MNFQARELRFGITDKGLYDEEAVKKALEDQKFSGVKVLSPPS
jgi:hypothetical protein